MRLDTLPGDRSMSSSCLQSGRAGLRVSAEDHHTDVILNFEAEIRDLKTAASRV
jgi:hypothetical protein